MARELQTIFSKPFYFFLAAAIFVGLFVILSTLSQFLFFDPTLAIFLPPALVPNFVLIIAVAAMSGLVMSMNVYRVKMLRNSVKKMSGGLLGSIIGASAGACSCGPIVFAVVSVLGTAGGIATSFLTNYEIPLRLVALGILGLTFYTTKRSLSFECKIKSN